MQKLHFNIYVLCDTFWNFLHFLALFGTTAATPLRNNDCCNALTQLNAYFTHDKALASFLTLFGAVLWELYIISSKVFLCLVFLVLPFIRIVSDSRMSSSQQKETCAPQKLSCIIRIFSSVKKDGNCNFSENIFPGYLFSFSTFYNGKRDFSFRPIQCVDEEWKSISTAKKVTARGCNLQ